MDKPWNKIYRLTCAKTHKEAAEIPRRGFFINDDVGR